MKVRVGLWAFVASLAGGAAAQTAAPETTGAPPPEAAALLESCSAHKFETTVRFTTAEGKRRQSNIKLCGTPGQTDAQWAVTLRDAANKLRTNGSLAPEAREQAIAAIEAELEKIGAAAQVAAPATTLILPRAAGTAANPSSATPEYSALPPLPAPAAPAVNIGNAAVAAAPASTAPVRVTAVPRLTVRCQLPSDYGAAGPCTRLERETQISVRADENLPAGLKLRFLRRGDDRGEVGVAALRQGQTLRVRPPAKLCAGVVRSSAQIQVVRAGAGAGEVLETFGPYELRC